MSARKNDVYAKSDKKTPRYHTVLSNSKYHSSNLIDQ